MLICSAWARLAIRAEVTSLSMSPLWLLWWDGLTLGKFSNIWLLVKCVFISFAHFFLELITHSVLSEKSLFNDFLSLENFWGTVKSIRRS